MIARDHITQWSLDAPWPERQTRDRTPRGWGALETVIDRQTGRLVPLDDVDSFAQAMGKLDLSAFDPARAQANAARFSMAAFPARSRGTSAF